MDSHRDLLNKGVSQKEADENAITVQLIGYMKKNPVSNDYKIDITREQYIDSEEVYKGAKDPDTSPRIDIRFMNWTSSEKFEYFFEAKNLYEKDFTKSGNKTPVDSKYYQKRYISTGIQNFVNGKYPHGCLVGYVLEGNPGNIADKINELLKSASRNSECLTKISEEGKQYCFISNHQGKLLSKLTHFFLNFI